MSPTDNPSLYEQQWDEAMRELQADLTIQSGYETYCDQIDELDRETTPDQTDPDDEWVQALWELAGESVAEDDDAALLEGALVAGDTIIILVP